MFPGKELKEALADLHKRNALTPKAVLRLLRKALPKLQHAALESLSGNSIPPDRPILGAMNAAGEFIPLAKFPADLKHFAERHNESLQP